MPNRSAKRNQVARKAATALLLYAGFIVAVCFLVLRFTVWNQPEADAPEPFYTTLPGVNMERLSPQKLR